MMTTMWCRDFFRVMTGGMAMCALAGVSGVFAQAPALKPQGEFVTFGFSTVEWGKEWDMLQLLENLQAAGIKKVELASDQAHGVNVELSTEDRTYRREQFEEAEIAVVGFRVDTAFDAADAKALATAVDATKQNLRLSHDTGGSGLRVRLGDLKGDETLIKQTVAVLKELGDFAVGFGQEIRVEAQAGKGNVADVVTVLKEVNHDQVKAAFGVGSGALSAKGLEEELKQLQPYLGSVVLVDVQEEGDAEAYDALAKWLVEVDFDGVVVLTTSAESGDKATAIGRQKVLWDQRIKKVRMK